MKTELRQTHVAVQPGQPARVEIDVTNTADVIDGVTAIVDGINPDWVRLERPLVSLFPEASDRLAVVFDIPRNCPAGDYLVVVRLVSTVDFERQSVHDFWLSVGVAPGLDLNLRPTIVTGGGEAAITAMITNEGNASAEVIVNAHEPTREIDCRVDPASFVLPQGHEAVLDVVMRGRRPWFGQPVSRQVHIRAGVGDIEVEKIATFRQKPRIPRGLITALILAGIILLWALIFLWVVNELRSSDASAKAVGTDFMTGPENIPLAAIAATASGTVTASTTAEGLPRITVEALRSSEGELTSVGSAATDDEGVYVLPSLVPGTYKLRFSADGFNEVWYVDDDGSDTVALAPLEVRDDLDVVMVGALGSLTGNISIPPGSEGVPLTVTATQVVENTDPNAPPPATFTQVTTDGTINLQGLPTPATYHVTVTGDGFQTQSFDAEVGGGQAAVLNTVSVTAAGGTIEGVVRDEAGRALGGVQVIARSGSTELRTVTPTAGSVGSFTLVGLTTPETYVLTFELSGYSSQTIALSLGAGQSQSVTATLVGGSGTVSGTAVSPDGQPLGGITVTVAGEGFSGGTSTLTTGGAGGGVGGFTVTDIPVPGTYSITFSSDQYQSETLNVTFTQAGEQAVGNVVLLSNVSQVGGTVRQSGGGGLGEATITLTDGDRSQVTTSATNPAGTYAFANVPPGSYTLTFERQGYARRVMLVRVEAGIDLVQDVTLTAVAPTAVAATTTPPTTTTTPPATTTTTTTTSTTTTTTTTTTTEPPDTTQPPDTSPP